MGARKEFNQDTYNLITDRIIDGCSIQGACSDSGISESTYRRWKAKLEAVAEPEVKVRNNGSGLLHRLKAAETELKALKTGFKAMTKMRKDIEKIKGVLGC